MKKLLLWLVLLGGIGVIVASFLCFDLGFAADNVRYLSLAVVVVAYSLLFAELLIPWVDWNDEAKRSIAGLGLRWSNALFYLICSLIAVVLMNYFDCSFPLQAIVHAALLLILILSIVGVMSATGLTGKIHTQEKQMRQDIATLKGAVLHLKLKMAECELPEDIVRRIGAWEEGLRYISPSTSSEAHSLEQTMTEEVESLSRMVGNYMLNEERILKTLNTLERLYSIRKSTY